jgi:hypothetical protein
MRTLPPKEFLDLNNKSTDAADELNPVHRDLLEKAPPADLLITKLGQTEDCRSITKRNQERVPPELLVSLLMEKETWELLKGKMSSLLLRLDLTCTRCQMSNVGNSHVSGRRLMQISKRSEMSSVKQIGFVLIQ